MYYTDIRHFEQLTNQREEDSSDNCTVITIIMCLVSVLLIAVLTSI